MRRACFVLFLFTTLLPVVQGQPGTTTRVSVTSSGLQAVDNCYWPSISANGRYVTFTGPLNIITYDPNGTWNVFVHDRVTGQTTRVSETSEGISGNDRSYSRSISGDGRYVGFYSEASNLVPDDKNRDWDAFVYDQQTGLVRRVSVTSEGEEADEGGGTPYLSGDGRYVLFGSSSSNLVAGDTNGDWDNFVHDQLTGETTRVSFTTLGTQIEGYSNGFAISGNGQFVVFSTRAWNMPGARNGLSDVFVYDRASKQTTRVSVSSAGVLPNGHSANIYPPTISDDGRFVAFESEASNLVPGDTNGTYDVFVHDRLTSQTTRVSVNLAGVQGNGYSEFSSISGDGRFVAFRSYATNLQADDSNGNWDIFVHDRLTGQTRCVSLSSGGAFGNEHSSYPSISADGHFVAFESRASNLVQGDTNGHEDVFVHEFLPSQFFEIQPHEYTITSGFQLTGNLASLIISDGNFLAILPDDDNHFAQVELIGHSPTQNPVSIKFTFEGSADQPRLLQRINLFNYVRGEYALIYEAYAPLSNTRFERVLNSASPQYVGPGGAMKAVVSWEPFWRDDPAQDGWMNRIDLVHWKVESRDP